jgi:hypothetical protein
MVEDQPGEKVHKTPFETIKAGYSGAHLSSQLADYNPVWPRHKWSSSRKQHKLW